MGVQSDIELENLPEPQYNAEGVELPITGVGGDEPLPSWALPGKAKAAPSFKALHGMTAQQVERALREMAPSAYGKVKPPQLAHDSIWTGSDGRSAGEQWKIYLTALVNTEIAITAQEAGIVATTGRMAGGGRGTAPRCVQCSRKGAVLIQGKSQGGCK